MVNCCVPSCCTSSRKCDPAISFHEFPSEPDIVAKWIRNINTVVKNGGTWYPRDEDKPYVCSKHFLPTDFNPSCSVPTLKARSVPTLFANILGFSSSCMNPSMKRKMYTYSPLIVKVNKNSAKNDVSSESGRNNPSNDVLSDPVQNNLEEMAPVSDDSNHCSEKLSSSEQQSLPVKSIISSSHRSILKRSEVTSSKKLSTATSGKKSDLELIEIGPNTFLKINPKVIKVAKKVTPSGNSVLQFIMNKGSPTKNFPEIITLNDLEAGEAKMCESADSTKVNRISQNVQSESTKNKTPNKDIDNVIGHLVDSHYGKELSAMEGTAESTNVDSSEILICSDSEDTDVAKSDFIQRAPLLLTSGIPVSRCLTTSQRLMTKIKQKNRELKALKRRLSKLQNRLESVENKCIVQERELSYAKVKKMKAIRKGAAKDDPAAVFILEQIKAFEGNPVMRWSDSTLRQCSIWCRKAPYAYEYFKKAELFKLPCLSTVKRFMKKCPPEQLLATSYQQGVNEDSSSDFNFDSTDEEDKGNKKAEQDKENIDESNVPQEESISPKQNSNETLLSEVDSQDGVNSAERYTGSTPNDQNDSAITSTTNDIVNEDSSSNELSVQTVPETTTSEVCQSQDSNLNVQEVVLPQGIVQCLNSKLGSGQSQYILIPAFHDQTIMSDHQYSVLQSNNGPLIIQNVQGNQLPLTSQEQLIFITHSADSNAKTS